MSGASAAPPRHVYTTAIPSLRETCGPALLDVSNLRGYTVSIKEGEDIQPLHVIEAEHAASAISKLHALNLVEDNVLNAAQNRAQAIRNIHCAKQYPSPENDSLLDTFSKMLETFKAEIIQQHRIEITNTKNELMGTLTQVQQRLGGVETRLGSVETRLGSVETRLESVETRLESVEERLGGVENRLSTIEKKFDRIPIHTENMKITQRNRDLGWKKEYCDMKWRKKAVAGSGEELARTLGFTSVANRTPQPDALIGKVPPFRIESLCSTQNANNFCLSVQQAIDLIVFYNEDIGFRQNDSTDRRHTKLLAWLTATDDAVIT